MEILHFTKSRWGGELVGIVVLAVGLSLGAALATYHPDDSSAFYTSTNSAIANAIGYYGATVAWIFVGFFGFASLLFPLAMLVIGWNRFWGKELEFIQTKLIGFLILAVSLPPLFDLAIGKLWLRGALIASGGYLGQEIDRATVGNLNRSGAAIVLSTAALVGLLLTTRISLAAVCLAIQQKVMLALRALTLQWARFTERRRKERMKEAIVRGERAGAVGCFATATGGAIRGGASRRVRPGGARSARRRAFSDPKSDEGGSPPGGSGAGPAGDAGSVCALPLARAFPRFRGHRAGSPHAARSFRVRGPALHVAASEATVASPHDAPSAAGQPRTANGRRSAAAGRAALGRHEAGSDQRRCP